MRAFLYSLIQLTSAEYDWLQPLEFRAMFEAAVNSVPSLIESNDEITNPALLLSLSESVAVFRGSDRRFLYDFGEFKEDLEYFLPDAGRCIKALDLWIYRPDWFVPRRENVEAAQGCVNELLSQLPLETDDAAAILHGTRLVDLMTSVIPVIRSGEAEYIKSAEFGEEWRSRWAMHTPFSESPGLVANIRSSSVLSRLVVELADEQTSAESVSDILSPYSAEARFWNHLVESSFEDSLMIHFPSFFDHILTQRNFIVEPSILARAVHFILLNDKIEFDGLDVMSLLSRPGLSLQPRWPFADQVFKYTSADRSRSLAERWSQLVSVVSLLDDLNGTNYRITCLRAEASLAAELESMGYSEKSTARIDDGTILAALHRAGQGLLGIDAVEYLQCIAKNSSGLNVILVPEEDRAQAVLDLLYIARVAFGSPAKLIRGFESARVAVPVLTLSLQHPDEVATVNSDDGYDVLTNLDLGFLEYESDDGSAGARNRLSDNERHPLLEFANMGTPSSEPEEERVTTTSLLV